MEVETRRSTVDAAVKEAFEACDTVEELVETLEDLRLDYGHGWEGFGGHENDTDNYARDLFVFGNVESFVEYENTTPLRDFAVRTGSTPEEVVAAFRAWVTDVDEGDNNTSSVMYRIATACNVNKIDGTTLARIAREEIAKDKVKGLEARRVQAACEPDYVEKFGDPERDDYEIDGMAVECAMSWRISELSKEELLELIWETGAADVIFTAAGMVAHRIGSEETAQRIASQMEVGKRYTLTLWRAGAPTAPTVTGTFKGIKRHFLLLDSPDGELL